MSKFQVGDIVTWNDAIKDSGRHEAVLLSIKKYGPGPFKIVHVRGYSKFCIEIINLNGDSNEIFGGFVTWVFRKHHYGVFLDKTGFIRSNISL